jgi:hypothetical protein
MKRIMPAALAALAAAAPAWAAERRFTVTDFDRIKVEGPFQVTLSTGRPSAAVATGSAQSLDQVRIEVQNRTLRVRPNRNAWGGYPGEGAGPLSIAVATHILRGATVTGSGSVEIDKAKAMRFDASLSGNGRIAVANVEADTLTLGLIGSGTLEMGGRVKDLRASINGGGDLAAKGLIADDAVIGADTAGEVAVGVRRTAKVIATGAGDVEIIGSPACLVEAMGSGRVRCGD